MVPSKLLATHTPLGPAATPSGPSPTSWMVAGWAVAGCLLNAAIDLVLVAVGLRILGYDVFPATTK
jgi:hypothetical protein